ncbi:MAG: hypothetical protein ACO3SH_08585 [Candidatus Puniceispirillaceae bacterium]|jgi:hypothetical protein
MNGWLLASLFRAKSKVGRCLIGNPVPDNPAQDNPRLNGKKKSARQREKAGRR